MKNTISEITVKGCRLKRMNDGEEENNFKAPNIDKIQNQKAYRNPHTCVSVYMKSVKSRKHLLDCTVDHETDAPGP